MILFVLSVLAFVTACYYLLVQFGLSLLTLGTWVAKQPDLSKQIRALHKPRNELMVLVLAAYCGITALLFPQLPKLVWPALAIHITAGLALWMVRLIVLGSKKTSATQMWILGLSTFGTMALLLTFISFTIEQTSSPLFSAIHWFVVSFSVLLAIISGALLATYEGRGTFRRTMSAILNSTVLLGAIYTIGSAFGFRDYAFGMQLFESAQPNLWLFVILLVATPFASRFRDAQALRSLHPALIVSGLYLYYAAQFPFVLRPLITISDRVQENAYIGYSEMVIGTLIIVLAIAFLVHPRFRNAKLTLPKS